jgi:hypothetical protein
MGGTSGTSDAGAESSFFLDTGTNLAAVHGGVLLQRYYGIPSEESIKNTRAALQSVLEQFQMSLVIVEDPAALPNQAARAELELLTKVLIPRPVAVVYEGSGFGAAAVRGIVMALNAASPGQVVAKMASSVAQGVEWLKQQGQAPGLHDFEAFLADVRKRVKERTSGR